ncbi:MAG: extracellular solute-binding protein [Clostridia bacterium]|nr:extracellular solute-binding protein [Clostridia bacterium]
MRRLIAMLLSLCVLLCAAAPALAAGVTIRTFTPFADMDFAAQRYMDMITGWESKTGNMVEDYSGAQDEEWLLQMQEMIRRGEADVVVLPLHSGLTVGELVTVNELIAAAPEAGTKRFEAMKEADGSVLLAPVRLNWEALYVNTDVLAQFGLSVPQTYEELLTVCVMLGMNGVLPMANALCEWSEIVLDCAALSGADEAAYGTEASLSGAQDVLTTLTQVGAFGGDPWNLTDMDAEEKFISGEAAMRIDADGLAQMIPEERADSVVVVSLPPKDGQARTMLAGTPMFGVAVTRACWQDDARSAAAVSFIAELLAQEGVVSPVGGTLGSSIAALTKNAQDMTGVLYDMNPDGFESWAESVVAQLMTL